MKKNKEIIFVFFIGLTLLLAFFITIAKGKGGAIIEKANDNLSSLKLHDDSNVATNTVSLFEPDNFFKSKENEIGKKTSKSPEEAVVIEMSPEKKSRLMGELDPEYKIRKDILRFLQKSIPKENEAAFKAAVKYAQEINSMYYLSKNQKEAIEINTKNNLTIYCFLLLYEDKWNDIIEGLDKLMRNTSARDKHMWEVDEKYFGWQTLGTGLTMHEENQRCKDGNY